MRPTSNDSLPSPVCDPCSSKAVAGPSNYPQKERWQKPRSRPQRVENEPIDYCKLG